MNEHLSLKKPAARAQSGLLQRKCACGGTAIAGGECAECRKKRLQRSAAGAAEKPIAPPIVHEVLRSPGQPLDPQTRAFMEPRLGHALSRVPIRPAGAGTIQSQLTVNSSGDPFEQEADQAAEQTIDAPTLGASAAEEAKPGHDFSQVRIHIDSRAAESARAVNALAYTVGHHIVFGQGQYMPGSETGRKLLAHELTHVIQQCAGGPGLQRRADDEKIRQAAIDQALASVIEAFNSSPEITPTAMLLSSARHLAKTFNKNPGPSTRLAAARALVAAYYELAERAKTTPRASDGALLNTDILNEGEAWSQARPTRIDEIRIDDSLPLSPTNQLFSAAAIEQWENLLAWQSLETERAHAESAKPKKQLGKGKPTKTPAPQPTAPEPSPAIPAEELESMQAEVNALITSNFAKIEDDSSDSAIEHLPEVGQAISRLKGQTVASALDAISANSAGRTVKPITGPDAAYSLFDVVASIVHVNQRATVLDRGGFLASPDLFFLLKSKPPAGVYFTGNFTLTKLDNGQASSFTGSVILQVDGGLQVVRPAGGGALVEGLGSRDKDPLKGLEAAALATGLGIAVVVSDSREVKDYGPVDKLVHAILSSPDYMWWALKQEWKRIAEQPLDAVAGVVFDLAFEKLLSIARRASSAVMGVVSGILLAEEIGTPALMAIMGRSMDEVEFASQAFARLVVGEAVSEIGTGLVKGGLKLGKKAFSHGDPTHPGFKKQLEEVLKGQSADVGAAAPSPVKADPAQPASKESPAPEASLPPAEPAPSPTPEKPVDAEASRPPEPPPTARPDVEPPAASPKPPAAPGPAAPEARAGTPTPDGKHEIKLLEDGRLIRCSAKCTELRKKYQSFLDAQAERPEGLDKAAEFDGRLKELEDRAAKLPPLSEAGASKKAKTKEEKQTIEAAAEALKKQRQQIEEEAGLLEENMRDWAVEVLSQQMGVARPDLQSKIEFLLDELTPAQVQKAWPGMDYKTQAAGIVDKVTPQLSKPASVLTGLETSLSDALASSKKSPGLKALDPRLTKIKQDVAEQAGKDREAFVAEFKAITDTLKAARKFAETSSPAQLLQALKAGPPDSLSAIGLKAETLLEIQQHAGQPAGEMMAAEVRQTLIDALIDMQAALTQLRDLTLAKLDLQLAVIRKAQSQPSIERALKETQKTLAASQWPGYAKSFIQDYVASMSSFMGMDRPAIDKLTTELRAKADAIPAVEAEIAELQTAIAKEDTALGKALLGEALAAKQKALQDAREALGDPQPAEADLRKVRKAKLRLEKRGLEAEIADQRQVVDAAQAEVDKQTAEKKSADDKIVKAKESRQQFIDKAAEKILGEMQQQAQLDLARRKPIEDPVFKARQKEAYSEAAVRKAKAEFEEHLRTLEASSKKAAEALSRAEKQLKEHQATLAAHQRKLSLLDARIDPEKTYGLLPCFSPDTPVWTPAGPKRIDQMQPGDRVRAYDFETQALVECPVIRAHKNRTVHFYDITVGGSVIRATGSHRFWVEDRAEWLPARELKPGMMLRSLAASQAVIQSIHLQENLDSVTYNLEIDQTPNFYVGPGVLVHNEGAVVEHHFGKHIIYIGTNPDSAFQGLVYVGQTDDLAKRTRDHRTYTSHNPKRKIDDEIKRLEDQDKAGKTPLSQKEKNDLEFYRFKKGIILEARVTGLTQLQARYLEQINIDVQTDELGADRVMNRREEVPLENMSDLTQQVIDELDALQQAGKLKPELNPCPK